MALVKTLHCSTHSQSTELRLNTPLTSTPRSSNFYWIHTRAKKIRWMIVSSLLTIDEMQIWFDLSWCDLNFFLLLWFSDINTQYRPVPLVEQQKQGALWCCLIIQMFWRLTFDNPYLAFISFKINQLWWVYVLKHSTSVERLRSKISQIWRHQYIIMIQIFEKNWPNGLGLVTYKSVEQSLEKSRL